MDIARAVAVLLALALTPAYAFDAVGTQTPGASADVVADGDAYLGALALSPVLRAVGYEEDALHLWHNHTSAELALTSAIVAGDPGDRFELVDAASPTLSPGQDHVVRVRDTSGFHPDTTATLTIRTDGTLSDAGRSVGRLTTWHNVTVEVRSL